MTDQPDEPIVRLLESLVEGQVEFIIVGGAAAVLAGVPVVTGEGRSQPSQRPAHAADPHGDAG